MNKWYLNLILLALVAEITSVPYTEVVVRENLEIVNSSKEPVSNSMCWVNIFPHDPATAMECPYQTCLNSTFQLFRHSVLKTGTYSGCGDTFLCSDEGKTTFCNYVKRISPYPLKNCEVSCCHTSKCNKPPATQDSTQKIRFP